MTALAIDHSQYDPNGHAVLHSRASMLPLWPGQLEYGVSLLKPMYDRMAALLLVDRDTLKSARRSDRCVFVEDKALHPQGIDEKMTSFGRVRSTIRKIAAGLSQRQLISCLEGPSNIRQGDQQTSQIPTRLLEMLLRPVSIVS